MNNYAKDIFDPRAGIDDNHDHDVINIVSNEVDYDVSSYDASYSESEINFYADRNSQRLQGFMRKNHIEDILELEHRHDPFRFFITVSFAADLSKNRAMEYGKSFAQRLTKKAVGKRWKAKRIAPITGIAIFEKATVIRNARHRPGGWHFHILVRNHPSLPKDDAEALDIITNAYWKAVSRLTMTRYRSKKGIKGKPAITQLVKKTGDPEEDAKKVQLVQTFKGLCRYFSKQSLEHDWEWADRFFYLDTKGIQSIPEP